MKKFFKKKVIIPIILVIVILICFFSCSNQAVALYEEEEVVVRDIVTYHNFSGNVEVDKSRSVISQAAQQVLEVKVEEGDEVKTGDVIAILDSDMLQQNIELKETVLSNTELSNYYSKKDAQKNYEDYKSNLDAGLNAQLNAAKASLDNAHTAALLSQRAYDEAKDKYEATEPYASTKVEYDAAKAAYKEIEDRYEDADDDQKAVLEAEYSSAKSRYETAKVAMDAVEDSKDLTLRELSDGVLTAISAYETAQKNYETVETTVNQTLETYKNAVDKVNDLTSTEASQMELDTMYDQLDDYTIKANMDGVITSLSIKEGSMVSAGMPVAEISDFSKMKIAIKIDEYDILGVEEGKEVDIYIDALEKDYKGEISKISKIATTAGGVSYFTSDVSFEADAGVRSGMSVEVKLISKEAYGVISVSMDALRFEKDNTAYVYVKNAEGKEEKRPVTVGITDGNYVEIKEGLSAGDIVLVTPQLDYMEIMMEMQ